MATYYIDPINGNDGDDGLSWANAFLTLNGAEDEPVAANDTVYVGPGVYRELLTCDVSGNAGNPITYIGDVTGENTDGVGGIVRITGSDNDQTAARARCIDFSDESYRTFRGFLFDTTSGYLLFDFVTNIIIEDCVFQPSGSASSAIRSDNATQADLIIRRCLFLGSKGTAIELNVNPEAGIDGLIENCIFAGMGHGLFLARVIDLTVRNCTFFSCYRGIRASVALTGTMTVENCIFESVYNNALMAAAAGDIVEDYNTFFSNGTDRSNVNVGGNSVAYPALFSTPILHAGAAQISGFKFPWWFGELSEWSQIAAITGNNEPTEELRGLARPVTAAKNSWGATQFFDTERETTTTHGGSDASIKFNDAGRHQIWVPVEDTSTDFSVWVYREANYAGNNPQMIIKQPGQADDVTTDAAAASQWNELTTTLAPAAIPPYVIVELVSRNTDAANPATNDVFFDDLTVT